MENKEAIIRERFKELRLKWEKEILAGKQFDVQIVDMLIDFFNLERDVLEILESDKKC